MLENKMPGTQFKNIHGCSYILTYEEKSKTKEPNSWLVTTFVESVHTEVQEAPKWRRARKWQCTLSVYILVCLCTYVKETPMNASLCFIAKRRWDHHILVCWWHTLLAPLTCLYLFQALSSSLPVPLCVSLLSYGQQHESRCHFALASLSAFACACAQFMHINVYHILTKLKFLKHYRHIYICMWSQHCMITCLVLRGSANNASLWSSTYTLTYTFSCWSQNGELLLKSWSWDWVHRTIMQVYTVLETLPKIAVYRPGNDKWQYLPIVRK